MSYLDKLNPVSSPDGKEVTGNKKGYKAKLQPISVAEPSKKDGFFKSLIKGPATILARPFQAAAALGGVPTEAIDKFSREQLGGFVAPTPQNIGDVGKDVGRGLETVSLGIGGGAISSGVKGFVKQSAIQGTKAGALQGAGGALEQGEDLGGIAKGTATGALAGAVLGGGLPIVGKTIKNKVSPSLDLLNTKLDSHIKDIFKGTTGDVQKINESALKARKGLELLQKESKNIQIPDSKAPLGSNKTKSFDLQKSEPNEILSAVSEMDKKISSIARSSAKKASDTGTKIDTTDIKNLISESINRGDIPNATGQRILKQIDSTEGNPIKIHDWIQDVNMKYGKKYQRGTIDDTATGKIADDIAEVLRSKLDQVVDRKGYAEAFGNNQELKRMLVTIAKKANKGVNFGDISTDAGLDLGISILTGNPAYMARTVGTGLFKGIFSKMRNTSGLRSLKKAAEITRTIPTKTKLPSPRLKKTLSNKPPKLGK